MIYHVVNKSIAEFVIFNEPDEFLRMLLAIRYYQTGTQAISLSQFVRSNKPEKHLKNIKLPIKSKDCKLIEIIAYCLMPTHLHLMLEELKDNGISKFMNNILNSYTHYFNLKHKRKGPLWQARSKKVAMETDEQLLYVTSYIHSNPVIANIADKPEKWPYSSYKEYLQVVDEAKRICKYSDILDIDLLPYKKYVEDMIPYQKELAKIKKLDLE